jgi:small subunit ribosomal protein S2
LKELEGMDLETVQPGGLTKKELLGKRREKDKLSASLGGIKGIPKVPAAVWIVDTKKEHLAIDEARKLGIPVVAILDTNCDPDEVDYPIPGNDDAIRSVALLTRIIADAVAEGLVARSTGATAAEAEPLADWERDLLGADEAAIAAAAAAVVEETVAEEVVAEAVAEAVAEEVVAEAVAEDIVEEIVEEAVAEALVDQIVAEVAAAESEA